ncbi:HNH endonuclease signature motif containing protein [Actinopolymorpha cephalotaxi]|nr:HNH endonuclease signature motif containing protein [Actinopolymorpha cephalotaxi]NYH85795.1 hypothetical protein [Actinopolymorpha cephalotaxi]
MSDDGKHFDGHPGEDLGGCRVLPAGFEDLPGGPELAVAIASVDLAACDGWELEEYVKGARRLSCWVESRCLTGVNELAHADPGMCTGPGGRRFTADFRVIVDRVTDAKPDLWDAIEAALFPKVLQLRGGLLRAKVEAEVLRADTDAAVERHKAKRSARDVAIWPSVDGVADLGIRGLSADQAAEAYGNIDAIARAVKSGGDPRKLGQLRADVAASLLTGMADIIDCSTPTDTDNHTDEDQAAQEEPEQDEAGQAEGEPDQRPSGDGHCTVHRYPDHDVHPDWCQCGDCAPAQTGALTGVDTWCTCSVTHDTAAHEAAEHHAAAVHPAGEDAAAEHAAGEGEAGVSAAGPAAASDTGSDTGSAAGQIPQQNRRPDEPTDPTDPPPAGSTPPRPPWSSSQPSWGPIRTRSKIQLNIPLTTLMGLSTQPGELGGFGPVITEVAERIVANHLDNPEARFSVGVTHPVTGRLLHLHPIPARFLRGLQAELVHARDQRCVWTTCRRPAATCHLDHNTEYADGGETSVDNIAPLCPRHHKAKTERDWKLKQTGPGEHTLTNPFGRQYLSRAPSLTDPAVDEPEPATAGARSAEDDLPPF